MRSSSSGPPPEEDLPFKLGELVLCRYSSYPYWPATIDVTHQKKRAGQHYCMHPTKNGTKVLAYWCTFADDDTGGWVRSDRMVRYHPGLVDMVRVSEDNEWFEEQESALTTTQKSHELMHGKDGDLPTPVPPVDLRKHSARQKYRESGEDLMSDDEAAEGDPEEKKGKDHGDHREQEDQEDEMDLGMSSDEETAARTKPEKKKGKGGRRSLTPASKKSTPRAKAKKEPRKGAKRKQVTPASSKKKSKPDTFEEDLLRDVDVKEEVDETDDVPGKKVASSLKKKRGSRAFPGDAKVRDLEARLQEANSTISKLKQKLKRRGDGSPRDGAVTLAMPEFPLNVKVALPEGKQFRSNPVDGEKFNAMMKELHSRFETFKLDANSARDERLKLDTGLYEMREAFKKSCETLQEAEDKAVGSERAFIQHLHEILVANVAVDDLRHHKAGNVVRHMGKMCKDMPSITSFCNAIYSSWKQQVVDFVHGKGAESSPSNGKSTPETKASGKVKADIEKDGKSKAAKVKKEEDKDGDDKEDEDMKDVEEEGTKKRKERGKETGDAEGKSAKVEEGGDGDEEDTEENDEQEDAKGRDSEGKHSNTGSKKEQKESKLGSDSKKESKLVSDPKKKVKRESDAEKEGKHDSGSENEGKHESESEKKAMEESNSKKEGKDESDSEKEGKLESDSKSKDKLEPAVPQKPTEDAEEVGPEKENTAAQADSKKRGGKERKEKKDSIQGKRLRDGESEEAEGTKKRKVEGKVDGDVNMEDEENDTKPKEEAREVKATDKKQMKKSEDKEVNEEKNIRTQPKEESNEKEAESDKKNA